MRIIRLLAVFLALTAGVGPLEAALNRQPRGLRIEEDRRVPEPAPAPAPVAETTEPEAKAPVPAPPAPAPGVPVDPSTLEEGTLCKWYGHGFVYITSESGVRIAVNPFMRDVYDYEYPQALPADIVLISSETADMAGGRDFTGLPQAFRSVAAVGEHSSHGIRFRGTRTDREPSGQSAATNTVFTFEVDGIRFCHLGRLGRPLDTTQRRLTGRADVVFLPLGFQELTEAEWLKIAAQLEARWIVPVCLETGKTRNAGLRHWDDLKVPALPALRASSAQFYLKKETLPKEPMILLLPTP